MHLVQVCNNHRGIIVVNKNARIVVFCDIYQGGNIGVDIDGGVSAKVISEERIPYVGKDE